MLIKILRNFAIFCALAGESLAADIIVNDLSFAREGLALVTIKGPIRAGDGPVFVRETGPYPYVSVIFDSPGGSLEDGLMIGETISAREYSATVGVDMSCFSACALAWLASPFRSMSMTSQVGLHAAYTQTEYGHEVSGVGNAAIGAYLNNLSMPREVIYYATQADPQSLSYLTPRMADRLGIKVYLLDDTNSDLDGDPGFDRYIGGGTLPDMIPEQFLELTSFIVLETALRVEALQYSSSADLIVEMRNGAFASVIGPFSPNEAMRIMRTWADLPRKAFTSSGADFLYVVEDKAGQNVNIEKKQEDWIDAANEYLARYPEMRAPKVIKAFDRVVLELSKDPSVAQLPHSKFLLHVHRRLLNDPEFSDLTIPQMQRDLHSHEGASNRLGQDSHSQVFSAGNSGGVGKSEFGNLTPSQAAQFQDLPPLTMPLENLD
jgi:hypothetical protein